MSIAEIMMLPLVAIVSRVNLIPLDVEESVNGVIPLILVSSLLVIVYVTRFAQMMIPSLLLNLHPSLLLNLNPSLLLCLCLFLNLNPSLLLCLCLLPHL